MREPRVIGTPPPAELAPALAVAARAEALEDVLAARFEILDVIVQDEFTHDVVARGWTPTATGTVDGPVVLGHAACRFAAASAYRVVK